MEVYEIGLVRRSIPPPTVVTTMEFLMKKLLKCLCVMEDVEIGLLRPATLPLTIAEVIILVKMIEVDLGHKRPSAISLAIVEFIILMLMVEGELGLKRPAILPLAIVEQEFMLLGEVDIGLRPATLPCASQEVVVYCQVSHLLLVLWMEMFMNMRDVDTVVMDLRRAISVIIMVMEGKK